MKRSILLSIIILALAAFAPLSVFAMPDPPGYGTDTHEKRYEMSSKVAIQGTGGYVQFYTYFPDKTEAGLVDGNIEINPNNIKSQQTTKKVKVNNDKGNTIHVVTVPTKDIEKESSYVLQTRFKGKIYGSTANGQTRLQPPNYQPPDVNIYNCVNVKAKKQKLNMKVSYDDKGLTIRAAADRKGSWDLTIGKGSSKFTTGDANKDSFEKNVKYKELPDGKTLTATLSFQGLAVSNHDQPSCDAVNVYVGSDKQDISTSKPEPKKEPKSDDQGDKGNKGDKGSKNPKSEQPKKVLIDAKGEYDQQTKDFKGTATLKDVKKVKGNWKLTWDNSEKLKEFKDQTDPTISFTIPHDKFTKENHQLKIEFTGKVDGKDVKAGGLMKFDKNPNQNNNSTGDSNSTVGTENPPDNQNTTAGTENPPDNQNTTAGTENPPDNQNTTAGTENPPNNQNTTVGTENPPNNQNTTVGTENPPNNQNTTVGTENPPNNQNTTVGTENPPNNQNTTAGTENPPQPTGSPIGGPLPKTAGNLPLGILIGFIMLTVGAGYYIWLGRQVTR
ncbi:hypothetical protein SAMN05444392_12111 [Seinonella peptonophila]|uniref:Uncharacterized protein n=1 Tax=Seinonella peptonophila TaxID=112248 RepID=A0A1M5BCC1_9BACL|nr:hypothetical protein [Seinonella peptonophila]SHF40164.1 hypothetical protein SAMN05444392_12111 [Seinonella peptonophila]